MPVEIVHGDARAVLPDYADTAHAVITSPPYDDLRPYGGVEWNWDAFCAIAQGCAGALVPGGVICWVVGDAVRDGSETLTSFKQAAYFKDALGLRVHETLIFDSDYALAFGQTRHAGRLQYIFVLSKGAPKWVDPLRIPSANAGRRKHWMHFGRQGDAKQVEKQTRATVSDTRKHGKIWQHLAGYRHAAPDFTAAHDHPAIFPLQLARNLIRVYSQHNQFVIDPFSGSGTTMRAAKDLGRHGIGIEINAEYVALSERRLAQGVLPLECPE